MTKLKRSWLCVMLILTFLSADGIVSSSSYAEGQVQSKASQKRRRLTRQARYRQHLRRGLRRCKRLKVRRAQRRCRARVRRQARRILRARRQPRRVSPARVVEIPADFAVPSAEAFSAIPAPAGMPNGRELANMDRAACLQLLRRHKIGFEVIADAAGVETPIKLTGPINGVRIQGPPKREEYELMDCRLAAAILALSPLLKESGIGSLHHYSTYRPDAIVSGTSRVSGHAKGLAIDLAKMKTTDGIEVDVLLHWEPRNRGMPPCDVDASKAPAANLWRRLTCEAIQRELFQVVLTPHYDKHHANHVHLELVPDVAWTHVQ